MLHESTGQNGKHAKKKKGRRRSVFQHSSPDDGCDGGPTGPAVYAKDFGKPEVWGMLHDSDEDSTMGRRASGGAGASFIDHRQSMAVMDAAASSQNAASGCMNSIWRRPSTMPRNSTPGAMSMEGTARQGRETSFRDPFGAHSQDDSRPRRRRHSSKASLRDPERAAGGQDYGSLSTFPDKLSQSPLARDRRADVVIDMDKLMEHVKMKREQEQLRDPFSSDAHSDRPSDEYNSQPSSRRSSESSSLDDVCLPIDEVDEDGYKEWPDVSVLEEFSKEEIQRLKREALSDAEDFHFRYEDEDDDDTADSMQNNGIAFLHPIITNIDMPELGNTRVNETEQLRKGRLRPKKLTPWHLKRGSFDLPGLNAAGKPTTRDLSGHGRGDLLAGRNIKYPPHIISNNPETFRFTYFREDLDSTIHSPTISGLLQPGQRFEELFVGSVYSNSGGDRAGSNNANGTAAVSHAPGNINPNVHGAPSNANLANLGAPANNENSTQHAPNHPSVAAAGMNAGTGSGTPVETQASTPVQPASTAQQSGSWDMPDPQPFWLDVLNPTEEEMKVLSKAFGIHPLTTEDIFLGEVREKVELFRDYYLVCFRSFDIVAERSTRKKKRQQQFQENAGSGAEESSAEEDSKAGWFSRFRKMRRRSSAKNAAGSSTSSYQRRIKKKIEENEKYKKKSGDRRKPRDGELEPLNVYIIVFRTGVLTFHFAPTPHPINVRRRARLLKDYLNVTADWIAYALIDDITDAFAPMIELIEDEVYDIEDAILNMHHIDDSSDDDSDAEDCSDDDGSFPFDRHSRSTAFSRGSKSTGTSRSSSSTESTINANIMGWKKKGDMLRRIGECRKRVMSVIRLLGSKADVIKGFAKRCNEQWEVAPRSEIGMYLGDIQDHIITMVASLNHYEKLLSRSHSNYLAQINIDMTKVNNDMNDVLGKITILGAIVMPMNIITGLWGMNVIVPGQQQDSLTWFVSIALSMLILAYIAYTYMRRRFGF